MDSHGNQSRTSAAGCLLWLMFASVAGVKAAAQVPVQNPPGIPGQSKPAEPPQPKKIGENLLQLGNIIVDTQKREVSVSGTVHPDQTLEFLVATKGGLKNYESVIELDTDAVSFNLALILIGLEKSRSVAPTRHFDPSQPAGDPVELFVEWGIGENARKVRGEELLFDLQSNRVPQMGGWVYTGSTLTPDGRFMAEMDGVLIGFVHDPASVIENTIGGGIGAYGSIRLNPALKLAPGTTVKLTVRAIPKPKTP